ncbi:GT2 family glycosyltransferase [Salinibacter ruber]|uniref:glycosyltransferase family 2 protein n=1 Tax=Salinibacter ruber TaxID=146919 RepID=UPI00216885FB|nr:glycosyltransferase family 2 protein [Salinibacter ruber]MCS3861697.1 GT2 family glycosyltransferase [Salinibacter ruber]
MFPEHTGASEAVVICTRNRPVDLARTLKSVAEQCRAHDRPVVVVDGSDRDDAERTAGVVQSWGDEELPFSYHRHSGRPAGTRQRNVGVDLLPETVRIVHFIDDDVTVHPGYFEALSAVLRTEPNVGGVGGIVLEPSEGTPSTRRKRLQSLFLLRSAEDGRVLPSGCTTSAQQPIQNDTSGLRDTEWLNGCSSYRRSVLEQHRFDEVLTGYSMLEDLDLSYRIHHQMRLVVQPEARLTHRRSSCCRLDPERYNRALTVHRRWFIEKHFDSVSSRLAYWWGLAGRFLAITASSDPRRIAACRGFLQGLRVVLARDHPLLSDRSTSSTADQD